MKFSELTEEQRQKAREMKTAEELVAFAAQEGMELTDEQLQVVAGGKWCSDCQKYFG